MTILVFSQYFWPESFIINDLARNLRDLGHRVVVATGKPNYPDGVIFEGYRASGVQKEMFDEDIPVYRVPLRPRWSGGALNLLLNYLSFVWSGLRWFPSLLKDVSFDAILVFAPSPITLAIPAIPLRRRTKAHLAIWVQDLWPESLAATGFVRNRIVLALVGVLVRGIYAFADTLLVQSRAFVGPVARYARADKIVYYASSLDVAKSAGQTAVRLPSELLSALKAHFCVVFAGNIGTAQAVGTLVDAASQISDLPGVKMVLVGSGSMLNWVREQKSVLGLTNLVLAGRFPMDAMPEIYRHAACLVVTLKDEEIFSYTVPAKVQAYLAAGRPIIAALNGEGARIVAEAGAGLTCAAEDSRALAQCVRLLHQMTEQERARLGESGRRYFLEHFEMRRQTRRLVEILEQRMAEARSVR
jgi:glycosyltransferase involved in cell wall biosynthesis